MVLAGSASCSSVLTRIAPRSRGGALVYRPNGCGTIGPASLETVRYRACLYALLCDRRPASPLSGVGQADVSVNARLRFTTSTQHPSGALTKGMMSTVYTIITLIASSPDAARSHLPPRSPRNGHGSQGAPRRDARGGERKGEGTSQGKPSTFVLALEFVAPSPSAPCAASGAPCVGRRQSIPRYVATTRGSSADGAPRGVDTPLRPFPLRLFVDRPDAPPHRTHPFTRRLCARRARQPSCGHCCLTIRSAWVRRASARRRAPVPRARPPSAPREPCAWRAARARPPAPTRGQRPPPGPG